MGRGVKSDMAEDGLKRGAKPLTSIGRYMRLGVGGGEGRWAIQVQKEI